MTHKELQDLLEFFGQEQACYTALLDLSRRQQQVIQGGDVDDLLQILGQKQQILARVADVEEHLRPYKKNWRGVHDSLDENGRQVLDLALSTVEELLAELIGLEKESERLLVSRRNETARELNDAVRAHNVHQTYAGTPPTKPARYLDIRSD